MGEPKVPFGMVQAPINIDSPRWDHSTFVGRLNHFVRVTNPLLSLKTGKELNDAKMLVECARQGYVPIGMSVKELYAAKVLYDSAFHPDSGDRMNVIGRMSFQVPGGTIITAGILVYYRTTLQVLAAQWCNQSFNALVNYTNRNARNHISDRQMLTAYIGAITGAVIVSVILNSLMAKAPSIVLRWVPFVAVASANCINISTVRQRELIEGVTVSDSEGNTLGRSRRAAVKGISQVIISRVTMTIPTLLVLPVIMTRLEKRFPVLLRSKFASIAVQTMFCGLFLTFSVPIGCSLFPQNSSLKFDSLESHLQEEIKAKAQARSTPVPDRVYFNKGL